VTILVIVIAVAVVAALLALGAGRLRSHAPRSTRSPRPPTGRRILFPFLANALSSPALEAALRLATAESATLVPVFLARVALDLPLETPLPRQCALALPLLEAIEQRATESGVPVDARIERGRNNRHALRRAIAGERFDRIVIAAAAHGSPGFAADEVAWLLDNAPGEIIVLRPSDEHAQSWHFRPLQQPREELLSAG
jgi:nucleotide-binding universal stress UspA family protein